MGGGLHSFVRRQASRVPSPRSRNRSRHPPCPPLRPRFGGQARLVVFSAAHRGTRCASGTPAGWLAKDSWTPRRHERMATVCQTIGKPLTTPHALLPRGRPHLPEKDYQLSYRSRKRSLRPHHHPIIMPHNPTQIENRRRVPQRFPRRQESFRAEWPAPLPLPHPTRGVRRAESGSLVGTSRA